MTSIVLRSYLVSSRFVGRLVRNESGQGELVSLGIILTIVVLIGGAFILAGPTLKSDISNTFTNLGTQLGG